MDFPRNPSTKASAEYCRMPSNRGRCQGHYVPPWDDRTNLRLQRAVANPLGFFVHREIR